MDISRSYFGYPQYMLYECDDGYFLQGPMGDIATLEEIQKYAWELIDFATRFEKDIVIHNLENKIRLKEIMSGNYPEHNKKELPKKRRVYLMECGGRYKVGVSVDPEARAKQLGNRPFPVQLLSQSKMVHCAFEAEKEIHEWLDEYRIDGEWFDIPDGFVDSVVQAIADVDDVVYGYEED